MQSGSHDARRALVEIVHLLEDNLPEPVLYVHRRRPVLGVTGPTAAYDIRQGRRTALRNLRALVVVNETEPDEQGIYESTSSTRKNICICT
eukprot:scaffold261617_cov33-Prasinocladus_malaysianus.AAC.2